MGEKYIIELEDKPLCVFDEQTQTYFPRLRRVKGFNSLVFDEEGLKRLTPYKEQEERSTPFSDRLNEALGTYWSGSNRAFASACNVTEVSMSRYLSGDRVPKAHVVAKMAKALGVSADYLLGLEP